MTTRYPDRIGSKQEAVFFPSGFLVSHQLPNDTIKVHKMPPDPLPKKKTKPNKSYPGGRKETVGRGWVRQD